MHWFQRSANFLTIGTLLTLGIGYTSTPTLAQAKPPLILEKNHRLTYGTFLGGVGDDSARGVVVLSDGTLIVAGNFSNLQTRGRSILTLKDPVTSKDLPATTRGKLLKIAPDGQIVAELTVGNRIDDIDIKIGANRYQDRVVVGGDFGVKVIQPVDMTQIWAKTLPESAGNGTPEGQQTRVAISKSDHVVALRAKTVNLFTYNGTPQGKASIDRDFVNDVAIDPNDKQIYVVGFANRFNAYNINLTTGKPNPVQVPFLYALNPQNLNQLRWRSWDYNPDLLTPSNVPGKPSLPGSAPDNNMADGRLYQVVVGGDGKLAVMGEAAGGNNVFRWNGKDFTTKTIIKYDENSDTYNSRSPHLLYFAKLDPTNGVVIAGQHAVPRIPQATGPGLANTFRANEGALAVDTKGNIHIGGVTAFGIPGRDQNTFSGVPVAPYKSYEMVLLSISADFKQRIRWTPFGRTTTGSQGDGGGTINGVTVSPTGKLVVVGTTEFGGAMTTANGTAPNPFNPAANDKLNDVYLGILQTTP